MAVAQFGLGDAGQEPRFIQLRLGEPLGLLQAAPPSQVDSIFGKQPPGSIPMDQQRLVRYPHAGLLLIAFRNKQPHAQKRVDESPVRRPRGKGGERHSAGDDAAACALVETDQPAQRPGHDAVVDALPA